MPLTDNPSDHTREALISWLRSALEELELIDSSAQFDEDTGLFGRGVGLDSVEVLSIVIAVEQQFNVTIDDEELQPTHFVTVGALVTFIQQKLGGIHKV